MKRFHWFVVIGLAITAAAFITRWGPPEWADPSYESLAPRQSRAFSGSVGQDGAARAGVTVRLFEDVPGGAVFETTTDEKGIFTVDWTPTATTERRRLFLAAVLPGAPEAAVITRARSRGMNHILLTDPVAWTGTVCGADGTEVEGARLFAGVTHSGAVAQNGRVPRGARVTALALAPGHAPRWARFFGGDALRVHVKPGQDVTLRVVSPDGQPVLGAVARLAGPRDVVARLPTAASDESGRVVLPFASDGDRVLVHVEAPGFLPVRAPAWPGLAARVILWPSRTIEVIVRDPWSRRSIDAATFGVLIEPKQGDWHGRTIGSVERPPPARPGKKAGVFEVAIPDTLTRLTVSADGYPSETVAVKRRSKRVSVGLVPPRRRDRPGHLKLLVPGHRGRLPLALTADDGEWGRGVTIVDGKASVEVKPDIKLKVASIRAVDGRWLPNHGIDPVGRGKERTVQLALQPAAVLDLSTDPPCEGTVSLIDVAYARAAQPEKKELDGGRALFAVRPHRTVRIRIRPRHTYFEETFELEVGAEVTKHRVPMRKAAALQLTVRDDAGGAVPYAAARLWEPGRGGQLVLRATPLEVRADANGRILVHGLRSGEAAIEVSAYGLRSFRSGVIRLLPETTTKLSTRTMEPAPLLRGIVRDLTGKPWPGIRLKVLAPLIYRLRLPRGGERVLYDLASASLPTASTDANGRFAVPDPAHREGLIAVLADGRSDIAPTVFAPASALNLRAGARVEVDVSGAVAGVYWLLPGGRRAVLVQTDPPLGVRPLPVALPAGEHMLYLKMRNGKWATQTVRCTPGATTRWTPRFQ